MTQMRPRTLVIVGSSIFGLGLLAVGGWIVAAALNLADEAVRLSVFEPHAGGCAWYDQGASADAERQVTRFAVDCSRVQVAWDLGGEAALVWFPDEELASQDELVYLVDVERRKAQRLAAADPGEPVLYAFSDDDRILAFTENQQINVVSAPTNDGSGDDAAAPTSTIEFQGQRYASSTFPEGQDILAHALVWNGSGWQVIETKASRCCVEGAPGISALNSYQNYLKDDRLASRQSARVLTGRGNFAPVPSTSGVIAQVRAKLGIGAEDSDAPWYSLQPAGWKKGLLFRATRSGDPHATGVAMFTDGTSPQRIPGFTFKPNDVLQLVARGRYLLVTEFGSGMQPHLYDMHTGQLLYSSPVAVGVTFWPEPWKEGQKR
jgi:hypothetical protein